MSNSKKKTPAKRKTGTAKKSSGSSKNAPIISKQNLLIIAAVAVVALVVILIIAFSGSDNPPATEPAASTPVATPSGPDAAELVAAAPGKMTILCDVKLTLGFDEAGKVIALTGDSDPARQIASECEIVGLSCADAMAVIIPTLEGERTQTRSYITIRQDQTGVNPGDTFMTEVRDAAKAVTELPVVVISVSDMDENGYFGPEKARSFIRAALGDRAEISHMTEMYEGKYLATIKLGDETADYIIGAVDGSVVPDVDTSDEPYDELFHEGFGDTPSDNPNLEEDEENKEEEKAEDVQDEEQKEDSTAEKKEETT